MKTYCLELQRSDVPEAIDDRDQLVSMVERLNVGRLPKLPTSGSKAEQVERILAAEADEGFPECLRAPRAELESLKGADLKARLDAINAGRAGLLPTSGTRHELAALLRANGVEVTLWSDVKQQWTDNNTERIALDRDTWKQLHDMRDAVLAHSAASRLLAHEGEAEMSAYWVDDDTGQLCRVRPDYWRRDGILVDVKTTEDASTEAFTRSIANYRYYVQDAMYVHGVGRALQAAQERGEFVDWMTPRAFVFIAVEKTACVVDGVAKGVAVYRLDDESRTLGALEWREDLRRFDECHRTGIWPGYDAKIQPISLPAWRIARSAAATA